MRKNQYKVVWAGIDPSTGKPWNPSWVEKDNCTSALVRSWKRKKEEERKGNEKFDNLEYTASQSRTRMSTKFRLHLGYNYFPGRARYKVATVLSHNNLTVKRKANPSSLKGQYRAHQQTS